MKKEITQSEDKKFSNLYKSISAVLQNARKNAYKAVNFAMVSSYWTIGKLIIEDEQNGNGRAEYGKAVLKKLSEKLTQEFGKGFDESNLRYMRLFYTEFPICDTLRHELTWSHYRMLLRVKDENARTWYMNEAVVKYSVLAEAKKIFASKYELTLPKPEELEEQLKLNRVLIEEKMKNRK